MTMRFRSNSGSGRSTRPFTRSWRFHTRLKRRATFGRGCFAARPARSPFVNDAVDSTFRLTSGVGFEKVLPAYALDSFYRRLLVSVHLDRRAAAARLHANHSQS